MNIPRLVAIAVALGLPMAGSLADHHVVTVTTADPDSLHVDAEITLSSDIVGMMITESDQLPNGQADLVRNLSVTDVSGRSVESTVLSGGDWKLTGVGVGDIVRVAYDVSLEHQQYQWGPGIDEVAYRTADGLFFTGASLFMASALESDKEIAVEFVLPEGWIASTPWRRQGDGHVAKGTRDLLRNCLFLGTHVEETVTLGDFRFVMALGNDLAAARPLFVGTMDKLLPAFVETFGGLPNETKYLVVVNRAGRTDGGAFGGSYSMLIAGPVDETSSVVWGHGVAHELLHFWNGHTLFPASESSEDWFKDGFTDYYTLLHRSRSGLDTPQNTLRKLENAARRYVLARRLLGLGDSLREAGADKHRKRFLVYAGGALVALALDVRIREATENEKSLDDVMRAMYGEFGKTGKAYTYEDIERTTTQVMGSDSTGFLNRYVQGAETLDLAPAFEAMGLRLDTFADEFYLSVAANPTELQARLRRSMLGR